MLFITFLLKIWIGFFLFVRKIFSAKNFIFANKLKFKMMKYILIFCCLFYGVKSWGQLEQFGKKNPKILIDSKAEIPADFSPIPQKPRQWNHFFEKKDFNLLDKNEKQVDFTGKSRYIRPEFELPKAVSRSFEEEKYEPEKLKRDQYFGEKIVQTELLNVYCRDHQAIDGDLVDILLNDEVVVHNVFLTADFKGFNLPLKVGFNKIEFRAINQGSSGPNTAQFVVLDENKQPLFNEQWNLLTGYKARFIIIKN